MHLLNMCGPQSRLCLLTFLPIASKQLNRLTTMYNRYSPLTRWCRGNAFALGETGPGFNSRLRQGFLCLIFCFVVSGFTFCPKIHCLSQNFAIFLQC